MAEATTTIVHPALAEVLRSERESLNQRFALRQRTGARIDDKAFQEHLRTTVNELVGGVADLQPERVRAVVNALFDASLDLFAAGLLGPTPKHLHVAAAWREVLPQAVRLLARDPLRIAGCLSNAVDHLASHSSARPAEWIERMAKLSPCCDSVPQWLDAGKVVAWLSGMVQYRSAALQVLRTMPWEFAARFFDSTPPGEPNRVSGRSPPALGGESEWRKWLDRLEADRWFKPGNGEALNPALQIVRVIGGFRGFGGPCLRPPMVWANDGQLFVVDGGDAWHLLADAFGTMWHRVPSPTPKGENKIVSKIALDERGKVTWDSMNHEFAELAGASSFACDGETLAVTLSTSHHVFLVARAAT